MISYTLTFLCAAVVALIGTPAVAWVALRVGAVAPGGGRNVHVAAMPRLGGVAIAVAAMAPGAALFLGVPSGVGTILRGQSSLAIGLAAGAFLVCAVGAWDDVRPVRPWIKLLAQILAASIAYWSGFRVGGVVLPFGEIELGWLAFPLTVLWIVGVTNAVNLIDGLDGLAAGVAFCASGTNFVVAVIGHQVLAATLMAGIMGALFGFLFYNFNPARIFMGDSGSYFLGFVLATASIAGNQKTSTAVSLLVPVLALGVPIFDTLFSIVRRAVQSRPIFAPDRGHIHHRLLDLGLTHRRAVLTLYSLSLGFAISAIALSLNRSWEAGLGVLISLALVIGMVRFVGSVGVPQAQRSFAPSDAAFPRALRGLVATLPSCLDADTLVTALRRIPQLESAAVLPADAAIPGGMSGVTGASGAHVLVVSVRGHVGSEELVLLSLLCDRLPAPETTEAEG